jgi:hypothetical protein
MSNLPLNDDEMPAEIDFSKGVRGLHHIPAGAKVFMPAEVLQRDIEMDREGSPGALTPPGIVFISTAPANVVS